MDEHRKIDRAPFAATPEAPQPLAVDMGGWRPVFAVDAMKRFGTAICTPETSLQGQWYDARPLADLSPDDSEVRHAARRSIVLSFICSLREFKKRPRAAERVGLCR